MEKINADEGYFFGLGAFETIAVEDGEPLFLERHLRRLYRSLEFLGIERRPRKEEVLARCRELEPGSRALKLAVSGENQIMTARPNPYTPERRKKGFALEYSTVLRNETSHLVAHKTFNYGDCILEKRRAAALGADELIFCNTKGQLSEGTTTNLFFVIKGEILTPGLSCGLLPGIVREVLIEKLPVRECVLTPEDIRNAAECFVTNSLMGVMPVNRLGRRIFPEQKTAIQLQRFFGDCRE